jgi:response regulator RpfG family c-di-GMP phosphodiesterase
MNAVKVLFVDDDTKILAAYQRNLGEDFSLDTAAGPEEGLRALSEKGPYAVIMADMQMPGMNGVEFLKKSEQIAPDSIRVMLTGNADQETAAKAVNEGHVFRFLNKPCPVEQVSETLRAGIEQYRHRAIEKEIIEGTLAGCVKVLTEVLAMVAPEHLGRGQRLRDSVHTFARHVGANPIWEIELAAELLTIGYAVLTPEAVRKLTDGTELYVGEKLISQRHPEIGHNLLVEIPRLSGVAKIILYQNKHFDGAGFPHDEVKGHAIPIGARIMRILIDRFELEQDGIVKDRALRTMQARVGHYDPDLLKACFECHADFLVNSITAHTPVDSLTFEQLRPGLISVTEISSGSGQVLVAAGSRLTTMMIERLRSHASPEILRGKFLMQKAPPKALPAPSCATATQDPLPVTSGSP